jgi:hypothetical protein
MSRKGGAGEGGGSGVLPPQGAFLLRGCGGRFLSRLSVAFDLLNLTKASSTS